MDNFVTIFHGGSVKEDEFGYVNFIGMKNITLIFDERPVFSELFARVCDEVLCNLNEDEFSLQGVLVVAESGRLLRRLFPIASEGGWEKYVKLVLKKDIPFLDLVVQKLSIDPIINVCSPNGHSPIRGAPRRVEEARCDPPLPNLDVNVPVVVGIPDAESGSNMVGIPYAGGGSQTYNVGTTAQKIPLTQNYPIMTDEPSDACSRTDGDGVRAGRKNKRKSSLACSYPNKRERRERAR